MAEKGHTDWHNCSEDYQINDDDVFKCVEDFYLENLQNFAARQNVMLKTYKLDFEKGIEVCGCEERIKATLESVKGIIRSIKVEHKKYNDLGYFYTPDGHQKMESLEEKHWVKLKIENDEELSYHSSTTSSNQNSDSPSYRWKFPGGQQLLLTYGTGVETGAEVVTEAFETDKSVWRQDLKTENKNGVLYVQFPVPSRPDQRNNFAASMSKLFGFHGYKTFAIEVDTCETWNLKHFSKCVVTSFVEHIQSENRCRGLKLYMCVTKGDTNPQPLKVCSTVLEDKKQIFEFVQIDKPLKEKNRTVKVEICKGDITNIKADAIVNTVSADLNLKKGAASKALLEAAGRGLQDELDKNYKDWLDFGEIAITKGHRLPCDYVLHGFLEKYDKKSCAGYKSEDEFYRDSVHDFLMNCLEKAAKLDCQIISFPVIGTGSLYYPTYLVAKQMFKTFDMLEPDLRPELVKIAVYYSDEEAYKVLQDEHTSFRMKKTRELMERNHFRKKSGLLKIVGCDKGIQSVKYEISALVEEFSSDKQFELRPGQKLKLDTQYDKDRALPGVFTPKSASRSQMNLHTSRRAESSSVNSDTPPASPSTKDECTGAKSLVSSRSLLDKDGDYGIDDGYSGCFMPGKSISSDKHEHATLSIINKTRVPEIDSVTQNGNPDILKSMMSQIRVGSGRNITSSNGENDYQSCELLKCSKTEFELFEFFQPQYIEKYKQLGCLLEYCDDASSIKLYGEKPKTKSIKDIRLDLTVALKKIKSLQSESIDTSLIDLKFVKKCTKEMLTKGVYIDDREAHNQVTIYSESFKNISETVHQLKIKLGIIKQTSRQERDFKSTSTYLSQVDVQPKRNSHIGNVDQKPSSPRDNSTNTGAKPKTVQRQFSWSTNAKHLEMFVVDDKIEVKVYQGSILHAPVDCIVNAANRNLQHGGGVARVISQAAGRSLDREGWEYIKKYGNIPVGDVSVTTAGQLNYACVIHAVGPNWSDYKPFKKADIKRCERDLLSAISKSLQMAERKGLKSIAFPGISAGIYACPWELCFVQYARAIQDYSKNHSKSKMVQEIHFVDTNEDLVKKVQYTFKAMINENRVPHLYDIDSIVSAAQKEYSRKSDSRDSNSREPRWRGGQYGSTPQSANDKRSSNAQPRKSSKTSAGRPQSARQDNDVCYPYVHKKRPLGHSTEEFVCVISPKQQMFVYTGAITDNSIGIDMIACGENIEGNGAGKVAQHIEKYLGQDYVKKKKEKFKYASEGKVVVVNLKAKNLQVAHVIMHQKKPGLDEKKRKLKVIGTYERLFTEAMKLKCKEVALPLIGSGKGGVPIEEATERLCEGLSQFTKSNPEFEMTIHLVNLDGEKTQQSIRTIEKLIISLKSVASPGVSRDNNVTSGTPRRNRSNAGQSPSNTRAKSEQYHQQQKQYGYNGGSKPAKTHEFHISAESKPNQEVDEDLESVEEQGDNLIDFKKYNTTNYDKDEIDGDSLNEQGHEIGAPANKNKGESDDCVICMEKLKQPKQLPCGHQFCSDCIEQQFVYKEACPVCGRVCGTITGDQPEGTMKVNKSKDMHCPGYENFGRIEITYHFPDGKQRSDHPDPGKWYKGFTRVAFLPDNKQGRKILDMLKVAFDRKLVFTIGNSRTTGQEGVITWNDIHHKTDPKPNTQFGYPDPSYLDRVTDELAAKGVTENDI